MTRSRIFRLSVWTMVVIGAIFLAPLFVMILTAFKPEAEVLNPASVIPKNWTLSNFQYVLKYSEEAPFVRWLLNSLFISTTTTLLVLVFSSTAAYAITRDCLLVQKSIKGRKAAACRTTNRETAGWRSCRCRTPPAARNGRSVRAGRRTRRTRGPSARNGPGA